MSLLLDALKRAERQKKEFPLPERPAEPVESSASGIGLSLILEPVKPALLLETPLVQQPPTPEITLKAPLPSPTLSEPPLPIGIEAAHPSPPQPAPDQVPAANLEARPRVAPTTPPSSDTPADETAKEAPPVPPSPSPPPQTTNEARQKSQKILQALAKQPNPKRSRQKHLLTLGGIAVAIALSTLGGLLWLEHAQTPGSIVVQAPPAADAPSAVAIPQTGNGNPSQPPAAQTLASLTSTPSSPASFTPAPIVIPPQTSEFSAPPRRDNILITVHPATAAGYQALSEGNPEQARPHYEQALENNPHDRDAKLGLASIALKAGNTADAVRWYESLLANDPRDPEANAGLASLLALGNPAYYENRLRQLNDELGQSSPTVLFALGTVHAMQSHWVEAQEIFFQLVTQNPRMPDYLFNLAVSLDHIGKYALARNYYQQALEALEKRGGSFDRNVVAERLATLDTRTQ